MRPSVRNALLLLSLLLLTQAPAALCDTVRMQQFSSSSSSSSSSQGAVRVASVVLRSGRLQLVKDSLRSDAVAQAELQQSLNSTGWDVLDVRSGLQRLARNDTQTMLAAGMLEGYLTAARIRQHYDNMFAYFFATDAARRRLLPRVRDFLRRQDAWARDFAAGSGDSAVARHTGLVLSQLDGLVDGFFLSDASVGHRDRFVLLMLNAVGDLLDLQTALNDTKPDFDRMSRSELAQFVLRSGRCSALVKATPGYEQLYMGHSSWFVYAATMRVYKHYSLGLDDPATAARRMSFSSYPGFLESLDDFYIMDSGLVLLQTTNNVFNTSLYRFVKPQSLLAWQRVRVANQIARSGGEWARVMDTHNSGTYNNQYMVIDLNKVRLRRSIDDGALTIVEQIPTLVEASDQTAVLRTGHWPSYNVPFHENVYNLSGYPAVVRKRGTNFSYQLAPRAKIFRREAGRVVQHFDMARILRFNEYPTDPYSEANACNSICCRGDLQPAPLAGPFGCYDSKFTDAASARQLASFAISGPTRGDGRSSLPPFAWAKFPNVSHAGLPPAYSFDWQLMRPH